MKWLKAILMPPPVLLQIWRDRVVASELSGSHVECVTTVTIEANPMRDTEMISGIGAEIRPSGQLYSTFRTVNPFGHPRVAIDDFTVAEHLLKHVLRRFVGGRSIRAAPRLVIQPMENYAAGLAELERRAFIELGLAAGARKVAVWQGDALSLDHAEKLLARQK